MKIDYHISDHHSIFGDYFYGNDQTLGFPNGGISVQPYWPESNPIRSQVARAVYAWTPNSAWVNEARFGFHRLRQVVILGECAQNLDSPDYSSAFGFVSGSTFQCGFPTLTISGFGPLGCGCNPEPRIENAFQGADSVSYTRGKHLFKFGVEIRHSHVLAGVATNGAGIVNFGTSGVDAFKSASPLESFLAGVPSTEQV